MYGAIRTSLCVCTTHGDVNENGAFESSFAPYSSKIAMGEAARQRPHFSRKERARNGAPARASTAMLMSVIAERADMITEQSYSEASARLFPTQAKAGLEWATRLLSFFGLFSAFLIPSRSSWPPGPRLRPC